MTQELRREICENGYGSDACPVVLRPVVLYRENKPLPHNLDLYIATILRGGSFSMVPSSEILIIIIIDSQFINRLTL